MSKTITRRVSAIGAAVAAVLLSLFAASPALASEGGGEVIDHAAEFSSAGQPPHALAILIVGVVVLALVLLISLPLSNLFEKTGK